MTNQKVVRKETVVKGCFSPYAIGCKNDHVDAVRNTRKAIKYKEGMFFLSERLCSHWVCDAPFSC